MNDNPFDDTKDGCINAGCVAFVAILGGLVSIMFFQHVSSGWIVGAFVCLFLIVCLTGFRGGLKSVSHPTEIENAHGLEKHYLQRIQMLQKEAERLEMENRSRRLIGTPLEYEKPKRWYEIGDDGELIERNDK